MSTVDVNGTTLYYELRGDGPPLAFISGAGSDAQYWAVLADALADEFTVLTYDRRANSRSPRPTGWTAAPVAEQADDAAGLLRALDSYRLSSTATAAARSSSPRCSCVTRRSCGAPSCTNLHWAR